jgi:hypothetical protein
MATKNGEKTIKGQIDELKMGARQGSEEDRRGRPVAEPS